MQPTDVELRAENARLHAKNQELEIESESVKAEFHNRGLVNHLREIIEDHRKTEQKLKDILQDSNQYCHSLRSDCKYARIDLQNSWADANLFRTQRARLSGAMKALTKNREDFLVELYASEQRELKTRIPARTRTRIGCLIETALFCMEADNDDSAEMTDWEEDM